ncbi:hypothetical protein RFI_12593, partial [Reticulomyxa filosa]
MESYGTNMTKAFSNGDDEVDEDGPLVILQHILETMNKVSKNEMDEECIQKDILQLLKIVSYQFTNHALPSEEQKTIHFREPHLLSATKLDVSDQSAIMNELGGVYGPLLHAVLPNVKGPKGKKSKEHNLPVLQRGLSVNDALRMSSDREKRQRNKNSNKEDEELIQPPINKVPTLQRRYSATDTQENEGICFELKWLSSVGMSYNTGHDHASDDDDHYEQQLLSQQQFYADDECTFEVEKFQSICNSLTYPFEPRPNSDA